MALGSLCACLRELDLRRPGRRCDPAGLRLCELQKGVPGVLAGGVSSTGKSGFGRCRLQELDVRDAGLREVDDRAFRGGRLAFSRHSEGVESSSGRQGIY